MLVDDNLLNRMAGENALSANYAVQTFPSTAKMFAALKKNRPSLILLNADMPGMAGFEAIRILKAQSATQDIPIIFLTARVGAVEAKSLWLGAVDCIVTPAPPSLLRQRVALHLRVEAKRLDLESVNRKLRRTVVEHTKTIVKLQNKIITAMAEMVEGRDVVTGSHVANTRGYLKVLLSAVMKEGLWAKRTREWDMEQLLHASQLHDVGKIAISDRILKKPGELTSEERAEMQLHVAYGVEFIERLQDGDDTNLFLQYAKTFIAYHHEKWDGSGYPKGLAGTKIPLLGRMMALVDVYDALTAERPYKPVFSHEEAAHVIMQSAGTHFDPVLVSVFEKNMQGFKTIAHWLAAFSKMNHAYKV